MKTFKEFTDKMRQELFPAGEAKQLKNAHTAFFKTAMIDLQTWVPCLQRYNTSLFPFCATYWDCFKTVVEQPVGVIRRIFTVANDDWCDPVYYWSSNFKAINCWAASLVGANTPLTERIQQGYYPASKNTDNQWGRARTGIWAIYRHRLYVAPYIQSNETLVVEWDGVKTDWADTDNVDDKWWSPDVEEAIKYYVASQHNLFYADKGQAQLFENKYSEALSDLIQQCNEMIREREKDVCDGQANKFLTSSEIQDDAVPTETTEFVHALISDWGVLGQGLTDVAAQIVALNPRKLFTAGDNRYNGDSAATLFASFGDIPFYPAFANHDFSDGGGINEELALVELPGLERYYSIVDGPVHMFMVGNEQAEPDNQFVDANTSTENSIAGEWLRVMLALSTARWKVVVLPANPWTSDINHAPGKKWARWPLKDWGADLVLTGDGHVGEHLQVGGLNYFECGLGGAPIRSFVASPPEATVLFQYNSDYAFLKMVATCNSYKVTFVDRHGTEIHTYELTK